MLIFTSLCASLSMLALNLHYCVKFLTNFFQTTFFNGLIMGTILLNCITIAMETTSLRNTVSLFFVITDAVFLGMFTIEFAMKVDRSVF